MRLDPISEAESLFTGKGMKPYSEAISQIEHALQCALLAEQETGDAEMITAALLHDIGHLMTKLSQNAAEQGIDDKHEDIGQGWLARHFTPRVAEAVGLHVAAKRYLCTARPGYFDTLSPASVQSLKLQGGPMTAAETDAFAGRTYADDAVLLREWDDRGKVVGLKTPDFAHFKPYLEKALKN